MQTVSVPTRSAVALRIPIYAENISGYNFTVITIYQNREIGGKTVSFLRTSIGYEWWKENHGILTFSPLLHIYSSDLRISWREAPSCRMGWTLTFSIHAGLSRLPGVSRVSEASRSLVTRLQFVPMHFFFIYFHIFAEVEGFSNCATKLIELLQLCSAHQYCSKINFTEVTDVQQKVWNLKINLRTSTSGIFQLINTGAQTLNNHCVIN